MHFLTTTLLSFGLARSALAATGYLYNHPSCHSGATGPVCSNLRELRCCRSANGYYYESGKIYGPELYLSVGSYNQNNGCNNPARQGKGTMCLATGHRDLFGVCWFNCLRNCHVRRYKNIARGLLNGRDNTTDVAIDAIDEANPPAQCQGEQIADIYHVAFPGEEQKPYDLKVVEKLMEADVIEWETQTFKADGVGIDSVNSILAEHVGDGLNAVQKRAPEELK